MPINHSQGKQNKEMKIFSRGHCLIGRKQSLVAGEVRAEMELLGFFLSKDQNEVSISK